jgi:hypothetical protein
VPARGGRVAIAPALALVVACAVAWWACRAPGLNNGAACARATECESLVCNFQLAQDASADGRATGTCVGRCTQSRECPGSFVCGRYDFRGIVPDSGPDGDGVREGPEFEILRSCRPKMTVACSRDEQCAPSEGCYGAPNGVCARRCSRSAECVSRFCVSVTNSESCGQPGLCLPECDDPTECGEGQYCAFAYGGNSVHGRCSPIMMADSGCPALDSGGGDGGDASSSDSGVAPALDSGVAPALDSGVAPALDSGVAPPADSSDASAPDGG